MKILFYIIGFIVLAAAIHFVMALLDGWLEFGPVALISAVAVCVFPWCYKQLFDEADTAQSHH